MYLKCNVIWLLIWIGISSAGRNRLAKIKKKLIISQRQLHHLTNLSILTFYSTPWQRTPLILIV